MCPVKSVTYVSGNADFAATFIGGDEWDEALLVEYPSKQAFLDMTSAPDYPADIREDALTDSRLYCTVER
jgi:hypothetical protein